MIANRYPRTHFVISQLHTVSPRFADSTNRESPLGGGTAGHAFLGFAFVASMRNVWMVSRTNPPRPVIFGTVA